MDAKNMIMGAVGNVEAPQNDEMVETSSSTLQSVLDNSPSYQLMSQYRRTRQQVREYKKVQRNEPCPCGSGKKYKNCCLDSGKYEGYKDAI